MLSQVTTEGLPCWLSGEENSCSARAAKAAGSLAGWGRPPGGRHGNPLRCSSLESPLHGGAWSLQSMRSQSAGHG